MKTAISIPSETFTRAEQQAAACGLSRSQFYTRAAEHYLKALETRNLSEEINSALGMIGEDAESTEIVQAGRRHLANLGGSEW